MEKFICEKYSKVFRYHCNIEVLLNTVDSISKKMIKYPNGNCGHILIDINCLENI